MMPRPSLKPQRTEEILDAFQHCVVRYGMQGTSLERIAQEANMRRTILRHYVGNKDDLIVALANRFESRAGETLSSFRAMLPRRNRVQTMLKYFFGSQEAFNKDESMVADALIVEANRLPEVNRILAKWFDNFIAFVERELAGEYPEARRSDCRAAALAIISTFFVMGSLRPMTESAELRRAARTAARRLVQSLAG